MHRKQGSLNAAVGRNDIGANVIHVRLTMWLADLRVVHSLGIGLRF
jgi:hypothetical protein